jgi:hypothetical protein
MLNETSITYREDRQNAGRSCIRVEMLSLFAEISAGCKFCCGSFPRAYTSTYLFWGGKMWNFMSRWVPNPFEKQETPLKILGIQGVFAPRSGLEPRTYRNVGGAKALPLDPSA